MRARIFPSSPMGTLKAIASKSVAHRLLICAAFAKGETRVRCEELNEDICATVRCLNALGARIDRDDKDFLVHPVTTPTVGATLDCGESGSTLRFLLPVACALGADAAFLMAGRLPVRPQSPLREELERGGVTLSPQGSNPLLCKGTLRETHFSIAGGVSSQFLRGLLFALAVLGKAGSITVEGQLESAPYVELTADALALFGVNVIKTENGFAILENHGLRSPGQVLTEGDWSNAAFPLCMGAVGKKPITVEGLNLASRQGDRAIVELLSRFGASIHREADRVTVTPAPLRGIDIDASQIPDLVPVLATVAAVSEGKTVIRGASRLRLKESDRLQTVHALLETLGGQVTETPDGLIVDGVTTLRGGQVSSFGDHRIAMSAAVASLACTDPVTVEEAQVTAKSYPSFWEDMRQIGLQFDTDCQ